METQEEFLFADGAVPRLGVPGFEDALLREIAEAWGLPIGSRVRVELTAGENFPFIEGRLELASAPDLPFNTKHPLQLRINGYEFSSGEIVSWSVSG